MRATRTMNELSAGRSIAARVLGDTDGQKPVDWANPLRTLLTQNAGLVRPKSEPAPHCDTNAYHQAVV
jgi:hypothetical protein